MKRSDTDPISILNLEDDNLARAANYLIASTGRRSHFYSVAETVSNGSGRANLAKALSDERGKTSLGHRFPDLSPEEAVYCAGWAELAAMQLSCIKDRKERDAALTDLLTKGRNGDRCHPRITGG